MNNSMMKKIKNRSRNRNRSSSNSKNNLEIEKTLERTLERILERTDAPNDISNNMIEMKKIRSRNSSNSNHKIGRGKSYRNKALLLKVQVVKIS